MFVDIPQNSLIAMGAVVCLLLIGSIACFVLARINPEIDYTELRQRIQSWWWMIGLLFFVFILSAGATIFFIGFLSFLALKEFLSIVPVRLVDRRAIFWLYISIPIQYYWIYIGWYGMFLIFIPVYVFLFIPVRMIFIGETKGFIKSAGVLHWSVMLTVYAISHIACLIILPVKNEEAGAIGLILYLLFATQFNDVSQYVWGKSIGNRKIIPKISPNKTWGGFIGGVCTVTLVSYVIGPMLTPLSSAQSLLAGTLISVCGFFGDVVISSVKRDLQIKDSGSLIPGHGGVLDRMDSLIYTSPIFFHYVYYLHY